MKQNKIKKYSLMVIFLLIGLFGISTEVKALTCNYSFDFTYEHTTSKGIIVSDNGTADFQLIFNSDSIDGYPNYNSYKLKVTGSYSMEARPKRGDGTLLFNNDSSTCPTVLVYQRRTGITGNINTNKFYILSENGKENGGAASDLINACNGKDADEEVLSGYRCGNIIGTIQGTAVKSSCSDTFINDLTNNIENKFTSVKNKYDSFWNEISNAKVDASSATTKEEAENICSTLSDKGNSYTEQLLQAFDQLNLESFINQEADSNLCILSTQQRDELIAKFINRLSTYQTKVYNEAEHKKINCIQSANLDEKEKKELLDETVKQSEETRTDIEETASSLIEKYKNKITSIDLGENVGIDCEGLLGDKLLDLISEIFGYVQIAAPILLIVLGSVDFAQAVMSDDKDALKKATSKFVKRAIICVAIFFVPLILKYLLSFLNDMGKDPLCGIK